MSQSYRLVVTSVFGLAVCLATSAPSLAAETAPAATDAPNAAAVSCPMHAAHTAQAAITAGEAAHRAALDARGDRHMGFRQAATIHHFLVGEAGGAIEVTARDAADAATIAQVRAHLQEVAVAFAGGDFSIPQAVHAEVPAGVPGLQAAGPRVTYAYEELPAGGRVALRGADAEAIAAVHTFLRYQIDDHGTGDPLAGAHSH
jgi:hypothetical protein